ncbi:MAG: hypothetical protein RLY20_1095 [Verrucomicrobiota bacterium]|jgi:hypothetical protein
MGHTQGCASRSGKVCDCGFAKIFGANAAAVEGAGSIAPEAAIARHTPGPWRVDTFGEDNMLGNWVKDSDGNALALIGHAQPNRVGNAHLIAAAPELLEALKNVMALHCPHPRSGEPWVDTVARAAISKAEGK